ncbi:alpha/beta fold hydrolase [Neomegalonema perideroedes]|uniref:alpha/beta fold hydrolase n=1 Tax=Neomegalonema perideroedes TaxID=217219 RepID=UPI0003617A65|nr:alpha/beta hydrolase [Neomegalonema perideroedes]
MSAAELIVEAPGARLKLRRMGDPQGRPLLFLHGGLASSEDYAPLLPHFADCACWLLDSRGHGRSTMDDRAMRYPLLASDAEAALAALKLKDPAVIGHSDGGITGLHLAARGKAQIGGLIALAAQMRPSSPEIVARSYAPLNAESWRRRFPDSAARYERENPEPDLARLLNAVREMWMAEEPENYPGDVLSAVSRPTLILGGDADRLVPRRETFDLAEAIPGAALGLLPFGGHGFHLADPAGTAALMRRFLEKIPA